MTVLVLGANGSGKSVYAEKLAARLGKDAAHMGKDTALYYVATMIPYGAEGRERVKKHLRQRAHMGFVTVEKPVRVAEVSFNENTVVLLEDVSNLLSNEIFSVSVPVDTPYVSPRAEHAASCAAGRDEAFERVFCDIGAMCKKCRHAVIVSIDGLKDAPEYDAATGEYIRALNILNAKLSGFADTTVNF